MKKRPELPIISVHRSLDLGLTASSGRLLRSIRPTSKNPLIISASELRDFLRCRVRWCWRHHHRITTKDVNVNLAIGSVVHDILARWYARDKRTTSVMRRIARDVLADTRPEQLPIEEAELVEAMCVGYAYWAKTRDAAMNLENIRSELWFELPLKEDRSILVRGFIDAAFRLRALRRTVGCFEHKTKSKINIDVVDLNLQLSVYLWALRLLYPKARRFIAYYNVLRKQMPGPRVKADLFARESIERTSEEIDQWVEDTRNIVRDMLDPAIYPNPMDSCSWDCDFQVPCMMRGRSEDLRTVLTRDYVRKDGGEIYGKE